MSKYIANNIFNDKISVYVTECLSTNDFLTNLLKRNKINEGTSVRTDYQIKGKGQRDNKWLSEKNSNEPSSYNFGHKPAIILACPMKTL